MTTRRRRSGTGSGCTKSRPRPSSRTTRRRASSSRCTGAASSTKCSSGRSKPSAPGTGRKGFSVRSGIHGRAPALDDLDWKILSLTAKRGLIGATREDFFREIRGLRYEDLEDAVRRLETEGYLQVEWTAPN